MIKSIYIHIPFCSNICSYCDFCKFYYNEDLANKYIDELILEIKENYKNELIDTIYIGGGTPSSLSFKQLDKLLTYLQTINISNNIEYTFECNVLDIDNEKLELLKNKGINRLSIGVESFNKNILKILERDYDREIIINKINLAKHYFTNINLDLMYAVPEETLEVLEEDLKEFMSLNIPHISTYSLIIEDHTKLGINNTKYIKEELDLTMYEKIIEVLKKNNYKHYEISNFSKEGYESKHNLTYWKNNEYYGFGLGASGFINNIRYNNTKNINKYLNTNRRQDEEIMTNKLNASNMAILGLRTIYGISKKEFIDNFEIDMIKYFNVKNLFDDEVILENAESYYINPKYWYVMNEILIKFI